VVRQGERLHRRLHRLFAAPVPAAQFNPTSAPSHPTQGNLAGNSYTLAPGEFALVPGGAGIGSNIPAYSVARWTAASAGTVVVKANFRGLCGDNNEPITTADVHVRRDGVDLGSGGINVNGGGNTFAFAQKVTVVTGDTIDFSVGSAGGAYLCDDVTGVDARVCQALVAP
jgi:hypothetical protein